MPRLNLRRRPRPARTAAAPDTSTDPTVEVLSEADTLSDQGRAAEAIDLLTAANRSRRDPRYERRLVDLRFEAFGQLVPPASPPAWPEAVEDQWPGVRIPEIAASALTVEAIRSGLTNHGSLVVRGLLSGQRVAHMAADIERALVAYDERERGERQPTLADWYEPFGHDTVSDRKGKRARGSIMTVESPPALFDLLEVFGEVGIDRLVREYFAESPAILARKATLRRVTPAKMAGWHQDGAFMGAGIRSLNVWIALTGCGRDAPGLEVVGRRVEGARAEQGRRSRRMGNQCQRRGSIWWARHREAALRRGRRDAVRSFPRPSHRVQRRDDPRSARDRDLAVRAFDLWRDAANATTMVTRRATRSRSCIERRRTRAARAEQKMAPEVDLR